MEQYIDKSALVAEIEKIKSIEFYEGTPSDTYACIMSRAEKFIKDYTRNCSNIIETINRDKNVAVVYQPWLTPDQARRAVEMAREEVIEKVCEFLGNDLCCYIKAQDFAIEHQRLENDLKQVMKDET